MPSADRTVLPDGSRRVAAAVVVLAVAVISDANLIMMTLVLGVVVSGGIFRLVRATTQASRDLLYVDAARVSGVTRGTILFRHILPNVASLLIIDATLGVGAAILAESSLSFFGFGIQIPDVSLGTLLAAGSQSAVTRPWLFVFPAGVLIILLFAISLIGDALRDAIDPTSGANRA